MIIVSGAVRVVLTEVGFEQRSGRVRISHALQRGISECKDPTAESRLSCARKSMKFGVTGSEQSKGKVIADEVAEVIEKQIM